MRTKSVDVTPSEDQATASGRREPAIENSRLAGVDLRLLALTLDLLLP